MIPFALIFCSLSRLALALPVAVGPALPITNPAGQVALLWTSIGLAVVTSFWQGLIVTIVTIAEQQGMWTFRFRISRLEHWWWIAVSVMLSTSFGLIVISFLSGNNSDSLGVLTLSTATAVAIVRYAIPAWRNRTFIEVRWLAWTGSSRTGIRSGDEAFCGGRMDWRYMRRLARREETMPTPSDEWGWAVRPPNAISEDPTSLLQRLDKKQDTRTFATDDQRVYDDGYVAQAGQVSLLWGEAEGFRRRVSRAISSMPAPLLTSFPSTYDGFNGRGLCLAMGILGRNKGLKPKALVFDIHNRRKDLASLPETGTVEPLKDMTSELERTSVWFPRPNKVMRSFYHKVMDEQYSGLGPEFVGVAVELALILLDCPPEATIRWLHYGLEQQSIELNRLMSKVASEAQLQTLYRASYTSMILSINYFNQDYHHNHHRPPCRPDLTCFALLWLAEVSGKPEMPEWWEEEWVGERLTAEASGLRGKWQRAASGLLGLCSVPPLLEREL